MLRHHVVLVPGFFGFSALGRLEYFRGVRPVLEEWFRSHGHVVTLHQVPTLPSASLRQRAARVLDTLAVVANEDDGPIHIVGHSTGGLDARLAIAPTASLPSEHKFTAHERLRTLITIATPHYGTPLAAVVGGAMGKPLLGLIAAVAAAGLRRGEVPLTMALKLGRIWTRLDDYVGLRNTIMDQLYEDVLDDFSSVTRLQLIDMARDVAVDQSLIFQLTAAGCDLLNAGTGDPDGVRYGCVVTRAPRPSLRGVLSHGTNLYAQYMHLLFGAVYSLIARTSSEYSAEPTEAQLQALRAAFGESLEPTDNDGVVPSFSQIWGDVVHAASADHLDVVGHFTPSQGMPGRLDIFASASEFHEPQFVSLWDDVARYVSGSM